MVFVKNTFEKCTNVRKGEVNANQRNNNKRVSF